ncbi:MAG: LysR family transcriptional regulator [Bauldia sp.]
MTLHQLRIFWAVAHAPTLTQAAKQLGLTQPSLSQQLSKLEESVGAKLYDRTGNQMTLTDAGRFLLRKTESILADIDEAESGVKGYGEGVRSTIRLAGISSVIRLLLPPALRRLDSKFPEIDLDVHEVAPPDTLEMLFGRRVTMGLVASNSVAQASVPFKQVPIAEDPYYFAVPKGIDLTRVNDPDADLPEAERAVVNRCIQFSFGTQHTRRVEEWYRQILPRHRLVAQCRTYEMALSMVQAGLGVCLVPAFTVQTASGPIGGIDLYATLQPPRAIVAVMPSQYVHAEPHVSLIGALREVAAEVKHPPVRPMPHFLNRATVAARSPAPA